MPSERRDHRSDTEVSLRSETHETIVKAAAWPADL